MALVKFGNGVSAMSGKVNGTVFSRNTYGAIARGWAKPTFPATTKQMNVNASFGAQSQVWRTLTSAQRTGWISLASTVSFVNRLGESIYLTGQAMFNKLNQNLKSAGQVAIDDAPAYTIPDSPTSVIGDADSVAASFTIEFAGTPVPANTVLQIWVTPQLSPGIRAVKGLYKLLANVAAGQVSPSNVVTTYVANFGALIADQAIWIKVRFVNTETGVASPFIQIQTLVA